jgi:hypothetical protein
MEVRDLRVTQGLKIDERGNIIRTRIVTFFIDQHGPFTIELPEVEYSPEVVQMKIEEEKRKLLQILSIK